MTAYPSIDHLGRLEADTTRFTAVLEGVDPATRVPSCPDWDVEALLWHLAEVQWFWAQVVGRRLTDREQIQTLELTRPVDLADLRDLQHLSGRQLHNALAQTPPDTVCWSWSREQTAAFSRRRQSHEALIHRVDAELAVGRRTPIDAEHAADGIDEILTIMLGADAPVADDAPSVAVEATDTGDRWVVRIGRGEIGLLVDRGGQGAGDATVAGRAADIDCWLWNREPEQPVDRRGDAAALTALADLVRLGVR